MLPIITETNKDATIWNTIYQQHNDREELLMLSTDYVISSTNKLLIPQHMINDIEHVTIPPHRLRLKIGDICLLRRFLYI
jgi:hypothetical protein